MDFRGEDNENVLQLIYLNSHFEAGIKSPLDDAILMHEAPSIVGYEKVDEIPFDFNRKRLSVVVQNADEDVLITKGEAESVFAICETVQSMVFLSRSTTTDGQRRNDTLKKLGAEGYRALGVATSRWESRICTPWRPSTL